MDRFDIFADYDDSFAYAADDVDELDLLETWSEIPDDVDEFDPMDDDTAAWLEAVYSAVYSDHN